jgi:hypothetical protein
VSSRFSRRSHSSTSPATSSRATIFCWVQLFLFVFLLFSKPFLSSLLAFG